MAILEIMDRICGAVLNKIHTLSPAGRYLVIDEDELLEAFPEEAERSFDELKRVLTTLCKGGYIDVKYSRGELYCIAPLKEYAEEVPPPPPPQIEEIEEQPKKFRIDPVLISAFTGSILGSIIISLIFAFV